MEFQVLPSKMEHVHSIIIVPNALAVNAVSTRTFHEQGKASFGGYNLRKYALWKYFTTSCCFCFISLISSYFFSHGHTFQQPYYSSPNPLSFADKAETVVLLREKHQPFNNNSSNTIIPLQQSN